MTYYEGTLYRLLGTDQLLVLTDTEEVIRVAAGSQVRALEDWWDLERPQSVCLWVENDQLMEMRFQESFPSFVIDNTPRTGRWQRLNLVGPEVVRRLDIQVPSHYRNCGWVSRQGHVEPSLVRWAAHRPPFDMNVQVAYVDRGDWRYCIYFEDSSDLDLAFEPKAPAIEHPLLFVAMEDAVRSMEARLEQLPHPLKLQFFNDLQACDQYIQSFDTAPLPSAEPEIHETGFDWPTYWERVRRNTSANAVQIDNSPPRPLNYAQFAPT